MKLLAKLSTTQTIIIIIAVVIVAIAVAFVLSYFVFSRKKLGKEVRALDKKFVHLHALVSSHCSSQIRRLEAICRFNLMYSDIHAKFLKSFKDISSKDDPKAQNIVNTLKDSYADKNFKKVKTELPLAKEILDDFEVKVNKLNSELLQVIKPEDDARQKALALSETYRRIRQEYDLHKNELSLVSETYDKIFAMVDDKFESFEAAIEGAHYDEANEILPKIDAVLHELTRIGRELPNLVAMVNTIIPDRIASLQNAYEMMIQDNYPLNHLTVNVNITKMNERLAILRARLKGFETKGVQEQLDTISASIDDFLTLFEEEKAARVEFENDNTDIYKSVNDIEKRFIKLKNRIPEVAKVYIINAEHNAKINEIQTEINKVGACKRSLDTLIHSSAKQPFSVLSNKMKELHKDTDLVISEIESFMTYLETLKTDSENAYRSIYQYFNLLKKAEKDLRDINNEEIANKYQPTIDHLFDLISQVNDLLRIQPIDVEKVNGNLEQIHIEGDPLLGPNGEIAQEANMKVLAENAIIYANRSRNRLADVDSSIKQSEEFFKKGQYEQSYQIASTVLKRIRQMSEEQQ